jgi:YD repeat-containing protein
MAKLGTLALGAALLLGCGGGFTIPGGESGDAPGVEPAVEADCENRIAYDDGWAPFTAVFAYDAAGDILRYTETRKNGSPGFTLARTYDANGRRVRQDEDTHGLQPEKRAVTWEYDEAGRVVRSVYQGWGTEDGVLDWRLHFGDDGRRALYVQYENGVLQETVHYRYLDGDPLIIEEGHDTDGDGVDDWAWRYSFAGGRWLTRIESVHGDVVDATQTFTYADGVPGQLAHEDLGTSGSGTSWTTWTWEDGRIVHVEYGEDGDPATANSGTIDYAYDDAGRPITKTWHVETPSPMVMVTRFTWGDGGLARVERRTGDTDQLIEGWSFTRGCAEDRSLDVRVAPSYAWQSELPAVPYNLDLTTWWGFPEAM